MKKILSIVIVVCIFLGSVSSFAQSQKTEPYEPQKTKQEGFEFKFETWQLIPVSLVLSPLILSTTQSDMDYAEAFAITTIGNVVLVTAYAGGGLLIMTAAALKKSGVAIIPGILGAALILGAPIFAGITMQETDDVFGAGVNKSAIPPLAVAGGMVAGWTLTGLVILLSDLEVDVMPVVWGIVALNFVTSTAVYALSRDAKQPPISMGLPIMRF